MRSIPSWPMLGLLMYFVVASSMAIAQEQSTTPPAAPPESAEPRPEELEPAVDTSAPSPSESAVAPDVSQPAASPAKPRAGARTGRAVDRLELDATQITGNRELPKVLYIVPWKRSDLGDLLGKPVNSLLDEVLAPVDRDVFKRENRYYRALQPEAVAAEPTSAPAQAPESRE